MTSLILGLLGGGAVVQILQLLLTRRQNARQINAAALGAEVQALESAINALRHNLDAETERHERIQAALEARIHQLEERICTLEAENLRLRSA